MFTMLTVIRKRPEVSTEEFRHFMQLEYGALAENSIHAGQTGPSMSKPRDRQRSTSARCRLGGSEPYQHAAAPRGTRIGLDADGSTPADTEEAAPIRQFRTLIRRLRNPASPQDETDIAGAHFRLTSPWSSHFEQNA
ncbi:hypothetical protein F9B16_01080 [Actinomadura montaniterrae]|uniref:Uncharacterized protein n=1 Tax=Actinomadura montaniterrae TaxID=1803903 RepID=A0A6L3WEK9_9ACTN|nr:hypothetical protein F9B16_01080 [Actinomadura montaniterrae]